MKVVIVSGGKAPSYDIVKQELKGSSCLICADSGANCLYEYNISPNIIVGDLDSINHDALDFFVKKNINIIKYPREKDFTDTEAAVDKAIELGAREITILGATGSRIDHILGNIGILLKCMKLGVNSIIKDENNIIRLIDKPIKLKGNIGDTFSLIPYCETIEDLSIYGAKYPLCDYKLEIGSSLGISNEFSREEISIEFNNGILILICSKD
ncbi:thiamine diphosphokinase [Clostridium thermopalmarium]|jgi:thiamine pyrophosphokinase|uniref:Thiamine diphosphokinase n=1 Tax=Clostridium thermopalmarium DSM 5974 TaxID=1121340 RepID=A0A2T0AYI9_9CLOT|nr:thiamine diphosphokinase [Clostridium thermopalmarium]MBE6044134.1 thiamine diphosphokinase [Clostridium thermopalmarium]PRR75971.1 Thiamine pyrophosphokinase [Clostridium thermopalmarium DSM 5974]PVZ24548.1 thiamine pyrophosphokinase [Clostridium thermopalmarium DSM 5974]